MSRLSQRIKKSRHLPLVLLLAMALLVGLAATYSGPNYYMDSTWYLVYARSVHAGEGLSAPITSYQDPQTTTWINQWPPLYPLLLALGAGSLSWGRATSIALLAVTVFLIYGLGVQVLKGRHWLAVIPALLFTTIPTAITTVFSAVYSEALFIPLTLGFLLLLILAYRPGSEDVSLWWAAGAAVLAALLYLTRYIGAPIGLAGILYVVYWARSVRHRNRWLHIGVMLLSFVPLILYLIYLWHQTGSLTGVQSIGSSLSLEDIPDSLRSIAVELLHGFHYPFRLIGLRSNWWGVMAAALPLLYVITAAWRRRAPLRASLNSTHGLLALTTMVYLISFWYLAVRSDPITARDLRHFVVIYPLALLLVVYLVSLIGISRAVGGVLITLYVLNGLSAVRTAGSGLDYNAPVWHSDPVIAQLSVVIPPNTLVHGQDVGYLSYVLGPEVPVRMFGGDSAFEQYGCADITYPPGYDRAAFTLMYSRLLQTQPPELVEAQFRQWAEQCGTVETILMSNFALLLLVRLER